MAFSGPLTVLYVDDDADIRRIVELSVSLDPEIDLRIAASGPEALEMIAQSKWRPDVVLLDVMMPRMNGVAVMRALREDHGLTDTPFIFITAMGRQADISGYRALDVAGIILKPFDPITLAKRIREMVEP